jgi:hypothetical protein
MIYPWHSLSELHQLPSASHPYFQIARVPPKRVAPLLAVPVSRRTAAPEPARGFALTRSLVNDVSESQ